MIETVLAYSDLISAVFGLLAAIVLGWPAVQAVAGKRRYQNVENLQRDNADDPATRAALANVQAHAVRYQLGDPMGALKTNLLGYGLLAVSFIFLGLASLERAHERTATSPPSRQAG